jgi:CHAT domain-containing protein
VDLLTLSACETAVPAGVDARGSALESLAHVALLRGPGRCWPACGRCPTRTRPG